MKCSIFKRTVCFLLIVTFLLGVSMPVFATNEDSHTESIGLNAFFENNYDTTLLDHNATGHMTFVEDMRGKVIGTLAMEVLAMIYGEEPEPNESKYMEVLINIMMTYEMENASDISEQCKMDTLKTAESLCMDAVKAGTGLLFELTNVDAAIEPLKDWLNIAVEGLGTIADNTENWIEGIGDLNALLQNYATHDAFLYQIESLATGELQSAASKLRTAMTSAMKIKLETYSDISEKNFQNYSEFFFKDMFFEALKLTEEYATDEGFQFFVELGSDVMDMVGAIDLGIEIGKLVGNVAVNGEDIINRVLEMKAVYDISVVLEHWLKDVKKRISTPYTEAMDNWAIDYVRSGNYLISCRIRGEYCMYSLLAKDSGLYSHFGEKTAQQAENVYNSLTMTLAEIKEQLDGILSVLIVNVGSEMPYEAVNANSKWNVYGNNGQLYDNYTLRIYDKQNLLNFVHTGPMDDLDPTVTEYVIDNTEPFVITLEEGYAYTFEFVDNADAEKVKLMTVGVTDDDPLLTSVVDVETEFGVTSLRQLTKVIRYDSNGSYTQHNLSYNENGLLENYLIEYHSDRFENTREYRLAYDSNNRLVCCKDPEKACPDYEYRYSQDGRLTGWSMWEYDDADCESKYICEYDNLGRLVKEYTEYSEDGMDVIIHTYDETGRLTSVVSNNTFEISAGTKTTMYDDQGRIAEKVHDFSGPYGSTYRFRYSYDYAPFILIECYEEGDWIPSSLGLQDIKPEELVFFKLDKTATFEMHDGYVSKIIGDDYTYVFSYGDGMIFKTGNINVPQDTVDDMNSQARTYQDILTMYHTSISLNWTNCDGEDEYIGDPDNACYMFKHYEPNRKLEEIGFALLDINNDGQDELFISLLDMAVSGSFYDMYTICNGEIVHVVSAGERDQYNLAENSSINNSGSGSALLSSEVNYRLDGTDGTLKINQAVVYDGWRDSENPWFYATTDYFDAETYKYDYNLLEPISEEKAFTLMADFPQNIYLNLIPFSEYNLSINTEPLN